MFSSYFMLNCWIVKFIHFTSSSLEIPLVTFDLQAVETESLLKPILSADEVPGA